VQAPGNWLNYNRYGYCYGNPLKYTDPSGEFIITAMLMGGCINLMSQIIAGNVNLSNFRDTFTAFGIGALSGLAGGLAGQAVSTVIGGSIGAIGGAAAGAAGGSAGGFVGGAGNAWMNGASFGDGIGAGLKGAGMGALSGGIIGGVVGGITSTNHGGNFWTGEGAKFDNIVASSAKNGSYKVGENMEFTNEFADSFKKENFYGFGDKDVENTLNKNLKKLITGGNVPDGYTMTGDRVLNEKMIEVGGTTVFKGLGKGSDVFLYKYAFQSKEILYQVMQHEFVHVHLNATGYAGKIRSQESAAYKLNIDQAKIWGISSDSYRMGFNKYHFNGLYPNLWTSHPFTPIKYLPLLP
jgi:hypothetical protein